MKIGSLEFTAHGALVLLERKIDISWVERAIRSPSEVRKPDDGTTHYLLRIEEHGNRVLRVVVGPSGDQARIITVFFDRREGKGT